MSAEKDAPDSDTLINRMQQQGGWWKDEYAFERWQDAFDTPSRKFEFYSQTIASRLAALFPEKDALESHLASRGVATRGDDLCLPHWEPPHFAGAPEEFPFLLMPRRGINYAVGGVRHLPWLRELPGAGLLAWDEAIEIHPGDAQRLGVAEGDWVWVESPANKRRLRIRVRAGTRPGTVGLPLGGGPWPPKADHSPAAGGHGLLVALSDPLAGVQAAQATRVRLRKGDA
jgi:anaerobic selenocysteine-containing dehydrogenase